MPVPRQPPWSQEENEAIVEAYFWMLLEQDAGRPFVKAHVRRQLQQGALHQRSHPSIEFKFRNISAVLADHGRDWVEGYIPAANRQTDLEMTVLRKLDELGWPR